MKKFSMLLACSLCVLFIYGCWNSCSNWWGWDYNEVWERHWKRVSCYSNWQIESKWKYKNGKTNGEWTYYYDNWKVKSKWEFKDGSNNWKRVYYYENWKVKYKRNFKDGKLNGQQTSYNENWEITSEEFYENGNLVQK